MKNSKRFLAIIILAIVAFVSCKKDNENVLNAKDNNDQQSFDYRQIEDKKNYFKEFRQKMADSKTDEAFNLEDAAWHLACLANLDFCKVNVEYDDVKFDTVEIQVDVTDDIVLLNDLNAAYRQMCTEIQHFKKRFNNENQNLYYINVSINPDGKAKIALMTSIQSDLKHLYNHTWYFSDEYSALVACDDLFSIDSTYLWNGLAATELQRILNLYEHHEYEIPGPGGTTQIVFLPTRDHTFNYVNDRDPYGSPFLVNSRVFAAEGDAVSSPTFILSKDDMCYCLDSYLGLGYDFIADNLYLNEHPICWQINCLSYHPTNYKWWRYYHDLYVEYGQLISINPPGPSDN